MEGTPAFAFDHVRIPDQMRRRGMLDHLGPPSERFIEGDVSEYAEMDIAPADWFLQLSDDFEREELGPDWEVVEGSWTVKDGSVVTSDGGSAIVTAESYPGRGVFGENIHIRRY